jgi:DNA polymerase I
LDLLYLVDAKITETNAIKLEFLDSNGEFQETVDAEYKPYFLVEWPLKEEDKEIIRYFSGEIQPVEKTDLFADTKRMYGKVYWPNPRIAEKASKRLQRHWESEVEFEKSYVYDRGLVFGASHSKQDLKPLLEVPFEVKNRFESLFKEIQVRDPLKYSQIMYWFSLLNQPLPKLKPDFFGKKAEPGEVYRACMLARIANIPLTEAFNSRHVSDWIKAIIYTYFRKNNILIPSSEELRKGRQTHAVPGALTIAPKAGTYFNTVVCDFESLYASCIDSFNLSYETVDCGHSECKSNRIPDVEYCFCTKRRGLYSVLVGALKELRIKVFKPTSKDSSLSEEQREIARATAKLLKLILVSSYGVTVRIQGLACPSLAEAITGCGRYILRESWRLAEENGLRPLYGDTDSLFLDNASNAQVAWLINTVKNRFRLDLAVDKHYNMCVLPKAKKAYFGILPDGTPDIKGVTAIKSNSPRYIREVFERCVKELSTVRKLSEYSEEKDRIRKIVRRAVADLRKGNVKLEDLIYSVRLYFDPNEKTGDMKTDMKTAHQPYQCALQLIDAGRKLKKGDTVSFVKVKPFKYDKKIFTVKPVEFVTNLSETNANDYIRNLLTALNQTLESMDIELKEEKEAEISRWFRD